MRVRAQNGQGWGEFSSPASILAASAPAVMAMATVSDNAGQPSVRISWTEPSENGSPITAYQVKILSSTPDSYHEPVGCDGASAVVVSARYCDVLMSTLSTAPFSLSQGDPIVAIARAANAIGWSASYSSPNSGLAVPVQGPPGAPPSPPIKTAAGESTLTVEMPLVPTALTGGSPITSYNLQYDQGGVTGSGVAGPATDSSFVSLVGEVPATNTAVTTFTMSGLPTNTVYTFRYRVKNKHGWGGFSGTVAVLTASIPASMSPPTFAIDAASPTSVTLTWTAPYNGGSPITAYTIEFQVGGGAATFSTEPNYCDGSALATLTSRRCVVPMATLRAAPLHLALDELV